MIKIINVISSNGLLWGLKLILWRLIRKCRSLIFGWMLDAKRLDIGSGCHIKGVRNIKFGSDISIFENAWIEAVAKHCGYLYSPKINIGNRVVMSRNVHIAAVNLVVIEDDVLLGSNIYISDHSHGQYSGPHHSYPELAPAVRPLGYKGKVRIGRNVWVGDNVTILGDVHIGQGCIIGANSVVTHDLSPNSIYVGSPAHLIKKFSERDNLWLKID